MVSVLLDLSDSARLSHEQRLCARARNGDRAAFSELYNLFALRLYNSVAREVRSRAVADDVVAETFQAAFQKIDSFRGERSMWFWLHKSAMNRINDLRRARLRADRAWNGVGHLFGTSVNPDMETAIDWTRLKTSFHSMLGELPDDQRRALELRYGEDLEREACAAAMNVTPGHFSVILNRAAAALGAAWKKRSGGAP